MIGSRGFFDPQFMQELKQKNDIVEVIGGYVSLDRKGGTYWACCPFHHERTPSFAVNPTEQFYHCFGCGVSGDVIKFVQEIESTDFVGAIQILASRAKITVPESNFDSEQALLNKQRRDNMSKIMLDCAKFYLSCLYSGDKRAEAHLQYISQRKLAPTTVKKFGLGASLDFYSLPDYLAGKGYFKEDLIGCGALTEDKNGKLVDAQAGRLIFPIINAMDEVVAFGGRLLEKTDFAKYKNTKETMLFNKSKTLYNINLVKKLKRVQSFPYLIIVEGYMDTISLYQAGFENVVASMGTSLTKEQARLAKRYSDKILISYDGDFAGQKADLRGLEILKDEGLKVKVVPMPDGLDPDDVVKQGKQAYQDCLDKAMPLIDYKIHAVERKYDLTQTEDKRSYVNEVLGIVDQAETESVKEELIQKLSNKTGLTRHSLERDLANLSKKPQKKTDNQREQIRIVETALGTDKEIKALRFILASKLFASPYAQGFDISKITFRNEEHKIIANYITEREIANEKIRPSELFDMLEEDSAEFNEIMNLNYEDKLADDTAKRFFDDSIKTLSIQSIEEELKLYQAEFSAETDLEKRKALALKINDCVKRRNKLKK